MTETDQEMDVSKRTKRR